MKTTIEYQIPAWAGDRGDYSSHKKEKFEGTAVELAVRLIKLDANGAIITSIVTESTSHTKSDDDFREFLPSDQQ